MPVWRTSASFDILDDADIIERLVKEKESGQASQVIRKALRQYWGIEISNKQLSQQLLNTNEQLVAKLNEALVRLAILEEKLSMGGVVVTPQSEQKRPVADDLEQNLGKSLGRFRK